jgi:hypothetical protein
LIGLGTVWKDASAGELADFDPILCVELDISGCCVGDLLTESIEDIKVEIESTRVCFFSYYKLIISYNSETLNG